MSRRIALFLGTLTSLTLAAMAQEPEAAAPSLPEELRALRQIVEQQSKQIEALTQEVGKLNQRFDSPPKATLPDAPPAPTLAPETPRAEAVVTGPKHTVAKGETLTSIAKRYNIPIADLQKANEIKDDRKLQIGQVLSIPAAGKTNEPSSEKKENP